MCFKDIVAFSDSFICSVITRTVKNINGFEPVSGVREDMVREFSFLQPDGL